MRHGTIQRVVAVLLCVALLLPNFTGLVTAASSVSAQLVQTNSQWVPISDPFASGDVPAYLTVSGTVSAEALEYDCGNGLTNDGAKSYMKLVTGTTASELGVYINALADLGFSQTYSNTLSADESGSSNVFYRFLSPNGDYVLTVYYLAAYGEVRIIADTAEDAVSSFSGGFVYESTTNEAAQPVMVQYGLSMAPNGYDGYLSTTAYNDTGVRNCGSLTIIRMPDNSLFVHDGGDIQQWSDEACADFMQFCRELTGKTENQKVVINTWYLSHSHTDHYLGIPRFFDLYHAYIDIQNVVYNIDSERKDTTRDISAVMSLVNAYFPNAKYYKCHTGDHFSIAGVEFDVIYTHEDRFVHNADKRMVIDSRDGNLDAADGVEGTYRDFLYEADGLSDFNDTSTVLKVTFPQSITDAEADVTALLYADVNLSDQVIMDIWPDSMLEADIVMVPHHGFDSHPELIAMSNASIFLYTQAKSAIYGGNGVVDYEKVTAEDGTVTYQFATVDQRGTFRPDLVNKFLEMHDIEGEKYFDTTVSRKTYWSGTETAAILFGDNNGAGVSFTNKPSELSRDSEGPAGFTVYTMDAPYFEYTGWDVFTSVVPSGSVTTDAVTTTTNTVRFEAVEVETDSTKSNVLQAGQLYAIVHNKTNQLMTFKPSLYSDGSEHPAVAVSVPIGTVDEVEAGTKEAFFHYENGVTGDSYIYLDQSYREPALWELSFTNFAGEALTYKPNTSNRVPQFGGNTEEFYYRSVFAKGLAEAGSFWTITEEDASQTFRVLQPNDHYMARTSGEDVSYNIRIEFFPDDNSTDVDGDGIVDVCDTCVIYYSSGTDDYRFLSIDQDGNWVRKRYSSVDAATEDLEDLKLRLYRYTPVSGEYKTVGMTGCSDYEVMRYTDSETVAGYIASALTVMDTSCQNVKIPCSGTSAVVGFYWLDMSAYEALSDADTSCSVTVKFRNDDGTDTAVGSVNINVINTKLMNVFYNDDDTVNINTIYGSKYGFMYQGSTAIYEEVVSHTNLMDMSVSFRDAQRGVVTGTVNITPDMLIDPSTGEAVDVSQPGEYTGLTLVYGGQTVDENFILNISSDNEILKYPVYPNEGSVVTKKQGTTDVQDFLETGVANIQLSATGIPLNKGVDLIIVMDLSGSMKNGLDTNVDAVEGQQSRVEAMEESLKNIVDQLRKDNADVRIAMTDFGDLDHYNFEDSVVVKSLRDKAFYDININGNYNGAYEFYNHLNWVISSDDQGAGAFTLVGHKYNQAHSQYTGQVIPEVYTGSGAVNADAFVQVNELDDSAMTEIIAKLNVNVNKTLGTNYDIGLEYAYRLGYAIREDNQAKGVDRDLVCIFMSDGAAIQYNYFSGNSDSSGWSDILMGVPEDITSLEDYYAQQENWPEEIEQISKVLLTQLTTQISNSNYSDAFSSLLAPRYRSIENDYIDNDTYNERYYVYEPDKTREDAIYFYTYMDDQGYSLYDWQYLYDIAVANGYDGDTFTQEYYHNTDNVLQDLIDLLTTPRDGTDIQYKTDADGNILYETDESGQQVPIVAAFQSQLQYPYYRDLCRTDVQSDPDKVKVAAYKYYELPDLQIDDTRSYTEQFFEAMESIGVTCDWNLYARLAEVNKSQIKASLQLTSSRDAFRALIEDMKTPVEGYGDYQTLSPYDYFYNAEGKNWWAEAMKGDPDQLYPVINKYAFEDNAAWGDDAYYGDVRNNFTTGSGLELDGKDFISGFKGLGMDLYTVSFSICDDNLLTAQTAENVLKNVASGVNYFYAASTEQDLTAVLTTITSTMSNAATRAWYTDTMGPDFDLSTEKQVYSHDGQWVTVNGAPTISVMEFDVEQYTEADGNVTYVRTGTSRVLETVTFEDIDGDGDTDAWSDQIYTVSEENGVIVRNKVDIWDEMTGLITAKNFYYNANIDEAVEIAFGSEGTYSLASETFFWIIGVIGKTEMVLEYQVYLTGSIEGDRFLTGEDYYHATNTDAVLRYLNYMDQSCQLDTVSPVYPWGDAKLAVGYYLVNVNGEIIANQTTGETTADFNHAIKLTRPVYEYLVWNTDNTLASGSAAAVTQRPDGYSLYSPAAQYNVDLAYDGSGSLTITDEKNSTYVETLDGSLNMSQSYGENSYITGETVVWFAVVVTEPTTAPDVVVVDYGLPVDIEVLVNDVMFGDKGTLVALGQFSENIEFSGTVLNSGFTEDEYIGSFGTAVIEDGKVHYALNTTGMNSSEKFNYAVYYTPAAGEDPALEGYYYNSVTVIPATTIYYEDSFAEYNTYIFDSSTFMYVPSGENKWTDAFDVNYEGFSGAHQDQDRPGVVTPPQIDADNLYGYDSAYETCSMYSMGSAKKFTADMNDAGTVTFSFYGTGFDVISLSSSQTGTITVDVYEAEGYVKDQSMPIDSYIVDTYYGYTYDEESSEWVVTTSSDTLYQVPVMKISNLNYGHYTAVITIAYAEFFDHNTADQSYDFYMDAIRIYDPAGNDGSEDEAAGDAYVKDEEYAPIYEELRNILLTERDFYDSEAVLTGGYLHGAVFIDGIPVLNKDHYDTSFSKEPPCIGTYLNYGPNNEVYLAPGQAIAFELNAIDGLQSTQLAFKSTEGTAKIKIFRAFSNIDHISRMDINTATDRYYDLTELAGDTVIIVNVGDSDDGILSITNLKITVDPAAAQPLSANEVITISERGAQRALAALTADGKSAPETPNETPEETPGETVPSTGDAQTDLINCLVLLTCLCLAAIIVMITIDRRLVKGRMR